MSGFISVEPVLFAKDRTKTCQAIITTSCTVFLSRPSTNLSRFNTCLFPSSTFIYLTVYTIQYTVYCCPYIVEAPPPPSLYSSPRFPRSSPFSASTAALLLCFLCLMDPDPKDPYHCARCGEFSQHFKKKSSKIHVASSLKS